MDKDKKVTDNNSDFTESSSNMSDNTDTGESSDAGKRPAEFHVFRFSFGDGVGYTSTVRMNDQLGQSTGESSIADEIYVASSEKTDVRGTANDGVAESIVRMDDRMDDELGRSTGESSIAAEIYVASSEKTDVRGTANDGVAESIVRMDDRMDDELGRSTGESSIADEIDVASSENTDVAESMVGSPPVAEVEGFNPSPAYVHHSHTFNMLRSDTAAQHLLVQNAKDKLNRKKTALAIKSLHTSLTSDNYVSFEEAMKTAAEKAAIGSESELRSYEELKMSRDAAEYIAEEYFGKYLFNEELAFVEESIRKRNGA